ncbi:MAG: D-alanine--D-alanine ligase [Bdellovibrionales bacterium]|jgi:D-alanine-D-alanine ligase|nr:D-alanine--D-alanine ligase [Bdellovibrionales bacterium]MBT3527324.1 D-alanine--D-alanine ligase [Bdellovibrionales bacterium]MBT7766480.1 D-alanine--D-alanine ligase [Bdellovibrionales bacterium]
MNKINVILIHGGGGSEHEIAIISSKYIQDSLANTPQINLIPLEMRAQGELFDSNGEQIFFNNVGKFSLANKEQVKADYIIPCIHGSPGEDGQVAAMLDLMQIPYLGSAAEASMLCFNKISTKLWLDAVGIPNTPFKSYTNPKQLESAAQTIKQWGGGFLKAASQGSSVGCYSLSPDDIDSGKLARCFSEAFTLSPYVILEKIVTGRELEVAAFQFQGELVIAPPGEVVAPDSFYSYDEKYSAQSESITKVSAPDLSQEQLKQIKQLAHKSFLAFKLKDLARIDFFLTEQEGVLLGEINTFPGLTPISMFPQMMKHHGVEFKDYLIDRISASQDT